MNLVSRKGTMVMISDGDDPQTVPLVYYDNEGERHVVGKAAVQIKDGEVIALGQLSEHALVHEFSGGVNLEGFSLGPFKSQSSAHEASRRLGPLSLESRVHITDSNPNGSVRQCTRRDLHEPHEYQAEFGAYFNVYCPGNTGSER